MVQDEGLPDYREELLSKIGLQFFDLERWPEADDDAVDEEEYIYFKMGDEEPRRLRVTDVKFVTSPILAPNSHASHINVRFTNPFHHQIEAYKKLVDEYARVFNEGLKEVTEKVIKPAADQLKELVEATEPPPAPHAGPPVNHFKKRGKNFKR